MNWLQRRHFAEAAERKSREQHTDSVIRKAISAAARAERTAERVSRVVESYAQMDERLCHQ